MAITTLVPKIRACITDGCSTLKVYDTTGSISTENVGGWFGTNEDPANVTSATLSYTTPSDLTPVVVDVLATVNAQATITGEFLLASITLTPEDGLYSFVYTLTVNDLSVVKNFSIYSMCGVRCCVDKLWAKVAANALGEECKCTGQKTSALERAEIAEGLYNAIKFGAACNTTSVKDIILKKLQRLCNLEKCNCK